MNTNGANWRIENKYAAGIFVFVFVFLTATLSARAQDAAAPPADNDKEQFFIESADYMKHHRDTGVTELRGNVKLRIEDGSIRAEQVTVDDKNNTAAAFGRVVLDDGSNVITGTALYYDHNKEYFEMLNPEGWTTSDQMVGRLYYRGERAWGTRKELRIFRGTFTTCEPTCNNEAHFTAQSIKLIPDSKIIAKKAAFYIGAYRVWYLPYFVYSLKQENRYIPAFGYSKVEGYYVKNKYPYMVAAAASGWIIYDYMSRKGQRFGADHKYKSRRFGGDGSNFFTTQREKDTGRVNTVFNLKQAFKFNEKTSGDFGFDKSNTYTIYQNRSRNNTTGIQFRLNRNVPNKHSDSFSYTHSENQSATGMNENSSMNVAQNYTLPASTNFNYNFAMTRRRPANQPRDDEGTLTTQFTKNTNRFGFSLRTSKNLDLDGDNYMNDDKVPVNTTLPEIALTVNQPILRRLVPNPKFQPTLRVVHGRFREGARNDSHPIRKTSVEAGVSRSYQLTPSFMITPSQQYIQYFYHTKDAKYALVHGTTATYMLSQVMRFNFNYSRYQDAGGAPYGKDTSGESNALNGSFQITKPRTQFKLNTGYDYESEYYHDVGLDYTRAVSQNSTLNVRGAFDLETDLWEVTNTTLKLTRRNTTVDIGATWNTEEDFELTIAQINAELRRGNGWKFNIRAAYQDNNPYPFIREWIATKTRCCTEVQFSYSAEREEYRLNYYLLAFPGQKIGINKGQEGLQFDESSIKTQFGGTNP